MPWQMLISPAQWLTNTSVGSLPSTIERVAPYTPLVTANFNKNLDASVNNLQAFADAVDDMEFGKAETQTYDLYRAGAITGASLWAGTIATKPGGAPTTITVTNVSGNEAALVPFSTNQLAKIRMYNTTRGDYMLISNHSVATHTATFTANVPAGWTVGDVVTIVSQTVSGGGFAWLDLELVGGPLDKNYIFLLVTFTGAAAGDGVYTHPFEAFSTSKNITAAITQVATVKVSGVILYQLISNVISLAWSGTATTALVIREAGYLS